VGERRQITYLQGLNAKVMLVDGARPHPRLPYLFAANGGLIGFYDDKGVGGCPHCDPIAVPIIFRSW
jgi:hypothetical protein